MRFISLIFLFFISFCLIGQDSILVPTKKIEIAPIKRRCYELKHEGLIKSKIGLDTLLEITKNGKVCLTPNFDTIDFKRKDLILYTDIDGIAKSTETFLYLIKSKKKYVYVVKYKFPQGTKMYEEDGSVVYVSPSVGRYYFFQEEVPKLRKKYSFERITIRLPAD